MSRIPNSLIDDVLARTDIVDIVGKRVSLKKTGSNHSALCPFHNEKSPSFSVSQTKQFYYCFGCGAHGNAIQFLMNHDGLGFRDAIQQLAAPLGINLDDSSDGNSNQAQTRPLLDLMAQISQLYKKWLKQSATTIDYLKSRGLSGHIAKDYALGFAPDRWDSLSAHFAKQKAELITVGMQIAKQQRQYDRFRDRIMFPIRNPQGQVIAFGGRRLSEDKAESQHKTPKYLNSPETPLFYKNKTLYGLYETLQFYKAKTIPELIVVEGYMDVIALAQFGFRNAVATLGTAMTANHLQLLFRYSNDIIVCFDGDQAGLKAAQRALEHSLALMQDGRSIRFLHLPEGHDPDSFIRQFGTSAFKQHLIDAVPLSKLLLQQLQAQLPPNGLNSVEAQAKLIEKARALFAKLPADSAFTTFLTKALAQKIKLSTDELSAALRDPHRSLAAKPSAVQKRPPLTTKMAATTLDSRVARALSLVLHFPELSATALNNPDYKQPDDDNLITGYRLLHNVLEFCRDKPHVSMGMILSQWSDCPEGSLLAQLAASEPLVDQQHAQIEFTDIIKRLSSASPIRRRQLLLAKAEQQVLSPQEKEELRQLIAIRL